VLKKMKLLLVGSIIAATSLWFQAPAHAWTCESDLQQACSTAATVICTVVAKGRPCIY
jgi:hypothetical protein